MKALGHREDPPGSAPECPEEPFHARLEDSVPGLSAWVLGGSYNGRRSLADPGRKAIWQPLVEAVEARRESVASARATDVIEAGLEQRIALHLSAREHRAYQTLRGGGGERAHGVSVCEDCQLAFRPTRKSYAAKCDGCNRCPRPATPSPGGRTPQAVQKALAAGWVPFRATIAHQGRPDEDDQGGGWRSVTVARCDCGQQFEGRRDRRTCSETCRTRAYRRNTIT